MTLVPPGDNEVNNVLNGSLNGEGMCYTASAASEMQGKWCAVVRLSVTARKGGHVSLINKFTKLVGWIVATVSGSHNRLISSAEDARAYHPRQ